MSQHFRLTRITRLSSVRSLAGVGVVAGLAVIAGCNLDTSTGTTGLAGPQGLIQFINAAPRYSTVNLNVDNTSAVTGEPYGAGSQVYVKALSNPRQFTVRSGSDTTAVASGQLLVADRSTYTVILTQHAVGGNLLILPDTVSAPPANQVGIRIVNGSPSVGAVDLYVTTTDSTLATPTATHVGFESGSVYVNVPAGTVRVRITTAGTTTVLLDIDAGTLTPGQVRTILLVDASGGGLPVSWLAVPDRG